MTARPGTGRLRACERASACGSSGEARGRFAARVRAFVDDARAGATAITAAAVTVMTVGASALIIDHVWLVDQRDVLKTAADAAAIAATLEIERQLAANPGISDEDLKKKLYPVAMSYVFRNLRHLPDDRLKKAADTLKVEITALDRAQRTVGVTAKADLGGTLVSRVLPLLGSYEGSGLTVARAGVESETTPVEVVLAIDVSQSMGRTLTDGATQTPWSQKRAESRMDIVKRAAKSLVDILEPDARNRVAVGVVPWHVNVRLDPTAAREWTEKGWAHYPRQRTYPIPWWCNNSGSDCTVSPVVDDLPASAPAGWLGCLDSHRLGAGGTGPSQLPAPRTAKALFATPDGSPFAQSYFPPRGDSGVGGRRYCCTDPVKRASVAFASAREEHCDEAVPEKPASGREEHCYEEQPHLAQDGCAADQPVLHALSTNPDAIKHTIDALAPAAVGSYTFSSYGVLWAQRMLDPAWKRVWGGAVHPADPATPGHASLRKAIVLLTDGQDDAYCGPGDPDCSRTALAVPSAEACARAKARGTEIFVVAAMNPSLVTSDFASALRTCSSEADDNSDGDYVFLNNATPESLETAFTDIAKQLRTVRKVF